ncbi:hypothetical protein BDN72DRAFT_818996 [Pluteus cervinus]|uniref:Uncharacterized protein n=1 Tax=Pluteus cervinus TaxID=181527 RepID=A0ACD3AXI2_9AGAR|nr:hypothetical protein BDN72DRAFT_818996 [Pluteus cervinus]
MLPPGHNPQSPMAAPPTMHSALHMDPNQQMQIQQPGPPPPPMVTSSTPMKKRKKNDNGNDEGSSTSEPRRLRRSHEACARCRSKKIKCDSKHPRCTACATAGTPCHQEDRHRQTLTPRGHTERVEHQLAQCEALLKRHIPGFDLDKLDEILAREGIDIGSVTPSAPTPAFQFDQQPPTNRPFRTDPNGPPSGGPPLKGYMALYPPPPQHMMPPPGYPHAMLPYGAPPYQMPMQGPHGPYNPHIHPAFQPPPPAPAPPPVPTPTRPVQPAKGTDPAGNDLSSTESLAKNFGVTAAIMNQLPPALDKEDLAVGSSGLTSGRDREIEALTPKNTAKWMSVTLRRNSNPDPPNTLSLSGPASRAPSVEVWLPKDRSMVQYIVGVYFSRLNMHRPVFFRKDFERVLSDLYEGQKISHDPGFVCSLYLILALGTLSELNHRAANSDMDNKADVHLGSTMAKNLMPEDWPAHDEFFERALAVKPDLRVTISSLQALILLHWYLYTERQGRTLWRLVGSLVRLSVELGLHHDPTTQINTNTQQCIFSEEECQLRIRLWCIVLVHDRGTSILLGRPLAINPSDSNTPLATNSQYSLEPFSEHFELSHPVAEIQADIINSLYTPQSPGSDKFMRSAARIIKRMSDFHARLPERYKNYFGGTADWTVEQKVKLVQEITEDEGLTLLKIGIARILLLRAVFSAKDLPLAYRHRALIDAIITSHNTIIVHSQLIRFPDIAFFTSPIPLHIAAMVILYGHMSKCDSLPKNIALEDVWLALDMLPRFRWRWERKDVNGGHPLIAKLAERVMNVNLHQIHPVISPMLLCELEWDEDIIISPIPKSQQTTPTLSAAPYASSSSSSSNGQQTRPLRDPKNVNGHGSGSNTPPGKQLVDVPTTLFYPFFPESFQPQSTQPSGNGNGNGNGNGHQDYTQILAVAAQQDGSYGCQPSQDLYMSEEREVPHTAGLQMWMNVGQRQNVQNSYPPSQS